MIHQLRSLAVFAKVVEQGSLRGAARELKLSPSVVSHHLSQLEEELGVALLYRSTRKLSLTRNGERLLPHANLIVRSAEEGIAAALDSVGELSGSLRVTAPALFANSVLGQRIAEFSIANPKVRLDIDFSEIQRDVVAEGIDVAIRAGWLRDSQLKARKLYEEERVLICQSEYADTLPEPQEPSDLVEWNWLELSPVSLNPAFKSPGGETVSIKPRSHLAANNAAALYQLCRSGAGLAILPRFMADDDLENGSMQSILPEWLLEPIGVFAVRPHNSPKDGLASKFIDALV
ncbi:MAG: LysR family transcriptional regulator [Rhizobiaceae bacterium]|nr:LysR family transcriptional regulator [Rhizobiaceae bacterium]